MKMYNVPTAGHNLEIGGQPFFIESVTPNEPFRRREYNFNNLIGGTQDVRKGAYVGLDFSITTHVRVTPTRPDVHNTTFKKLMSKPVKVYSPEFGEAFNAIVKIKPEHDSPNYLKLTIDIKEVPDRESHISGEKFTIPKAHKITVKKKTTKNSKSSKKSSKSSKKSKKKSSSKKSKSKKNRK